MHTWKKRAKKRNWKGERTRDSYKRRHVLKKESKTDVEIVSELKTET